MLAIPGHMARAALTTAMGATLDFFVAGSVFTDNVRGNRHRGHPTGLHSSTTARRIPYGGRVLTVSSS